MDFEPFYLTCLAQGSYLIGSGGIAAIVDPQRDVDVYIEEAARRGLRIAHVIETHLHADFVSGHRELAERTGAAVYFGARADATLPHVAVKDGDEIAFGTCRLRVLETPGHTPESVSILVTDLEKGERPCAVLTGDTLFVGDAGRPDLAGSHSPQELAGLLYESLHDKLLTLDGQLRGHPLDEGVPGHRLESGVFAPFLADRGGALRAHVLPAEGAGTVRGIHLHVVPRLSTATRTCPARSRSRSRDSSRRGRGS